MPGSAYGVAIVGVAPTTSGPAVAGLVTGVGSILISLVVVCFGALGADGGWGPVVAGAFAVLAGLVGIASLVLGQLGYRQVRRSVDWGASKGRGLAVAGMVCAGVGLAVTVAGVVMAVALEGAAAVERPSFRAAAAGEPPSRWGCRRRRAGVAGGGRRGCRRRTAGGAGGGGWPAEPVRAPEGRLAGESPASAGG